MTAVTDRAALARKYDGPLPVNASVAHDADQPWEVQLRNRRTWAWDSVRRIGRDCLHHRREAVRLASAHHHREWMRLRRQLRFAVDSWRNFRDWTTPRDAEKGRMAAE